MLELFREKFPELHSVNGWPPELGVKSHSQ